jgi:hypothetical protein
VSREARLEAGVAGWPGIAPVASAAGAEERRGELGENPPDM